MSKKNGFSMGEMNYIDEDGISHNWKFKLPNLENLPKDIYSNHVVINHTPNEFTFLFLRVQTPMDKSQFPEGEEMEVPVVGKIVMTPQIAKSFLNALTSNWKSFENNYLKPKEDKNANS